MRLPPHVPSQGPLRPAHSALRFSPGLASPWGLLGAPLLAASGPEARLMPFAVKGAAPLTERLDVRVSPAEKEQLREIAAAAGVPVAQLVRRRALGRPVVARTDATAIRELRRLGGLVKKIHLDSGGAYSRDTAALLDVLRSAITRLAEGDKAQPR
jgi:hypothetical protein